MIALIMILIQTVARARESSRDACLNWPWSWNTTPRSVFGSASFGSNTNNNYNNNNNDNNYIKRNINENNNNNNSY